MSETLAHTDRAPPDAIGQNPSFRRFAIDAWRVLWTNPSFLVLSVGSLVAFNIVEPSLSLVIKRTTDAVQKPGGTVADAVLAQAPLYLKLVLALCALKLTTGFAKGVLDSSLVLALQREYLSRRPRGDTPDDVSRMMFDCREAKTVLDPFHFDLWRNVPRLISVLVWQYTLAPVWLPLLLVATAPYLLAVVIFAPLQQRARGRMLLANSQVARAARGSAAELRLRQRHLLRRWAWLHLWIGLMNAVMEWALWPSLMLVFLCSRYVDVRVVPRSIDMGELAVFAFNMSLIGLPIRELGMMYTKIRGHWPAMLRVLYPQRASAVTDQTDEEGVQNDHNVELVAR